MVLGNQHSVVVVAVVVVAVVVAGVWLLGWEMVEARLQVALGYCQQREMGRAIVMKISVVLQCHLEQATYTYTDATPCADMRYAERNTSCHIVPAGGGGFLVMLLVGAVSLCGTRGDVAPRKEPAVTGFGGDPTKEPSEDLSTREAKKARVSGFVRVRMVLSKDRVVPAWMCMCALTWLGKSRTQVRMWCRCCRSLCCEETTIART